MPQCSPATRGMEACFPLTSSSLSPLKMTEKSFKASKCIAKKGTRRIESVRVNVGPGFHKHVMFVWANCNFQGGGAFFLLKMKILNFVLPATHNAKHSTVLSFFFNDAVN